MVTQKVDIRSSPSLPELISQVHEGVEILIVDGDKALATLRFPEEKLLPHVAGLNEGSVTWISDDFDDPLPDEFWLGEDHGHEDTQ